MSTTRLRFLAQFGAALGVVAAVDVPTLALGQVDAVTIVGPAFGLLAQSALNSSVQNKIALANYMQALQVVENMVFDHESFLEATWPSLTQYLSQFEQRWNQTHFLNRTAVDITRGLAAQFPGQFDTNGVLQSTFSDLQSYGLTSLGQWMAAATTLHNQTNAAMQNMDAVQKQQTMAQSGRDQLKGIANAVGALGGINSVTANGMAMMIQSTAQIASVIQSTEAFKNATQKALVKTITTYNFNVSGAPNPNITPSQLRADTQTVNQQAIAVPVLRLPKRG